MAKGICFKEPLFLATIEGRKNQTRRIMKIDDCTEHHKLFNEAKWKDEPMKLYFDGSAAYCCLCGNNVLSRHGGIKPRYKIGEIVYLKEPYCPVGTLVDDVEYKYAEKGRYKRIWKNKLFMPEKYARYFIEITDVKCERLQDISDEDCLKEGIVRTVNNANYNIRDTSVSGGLSYEIDNIRKSTLREAYAALTDKINGKGTWDSNPYVWVYDYKLISNK